MPVVLNQTYTFTGAGTKYPINEVPLYGAKLKVVAVDTRWPDCYVAECPDGTRWQVFGMELTRNGKPMSPLTKEPPVSLLDRTVQYAGLAKLDWHKHKPGTKVICVNAMGTNGQLTEGATYIVFAFSIVQKHVTAYVQGIPKVGYGLFRFRVV